MIPFIEIDNLNVEHKLEILKKFKEPHLKISGKITNHNFDRLCYVLSKKTQLKHLDISKLEIPKNYHNLFRQSIPKGLVSIETAGKLNKGELYERLNGDIANLSTHVDLITNRLFNKVKYLLFFAYCAALCSIDHSYVNLLIKKPQNSQQANEMANNFILTTMLFMSSFISPIIFSGAIKFCVSMFNSTKNCNNFYKLLVIDGNFTESSPIKKIDLKEIYLNHIDEIFRYSGLTKNLLKCLENNKDIFNMTLNHNSKLYLAQQVGYAERFAIHIKSAPDAQKKAIQETNLVDRLWINDNPFRENKIPSKEKLKKQISELAPKTQKRTLSF